MPVDEINLSRQNLTLLRQHFETAEGISALDVEQIVSDAAAVFSECLAAGEKGEAKGLIYGNIQSGKTAVILALMAIAADNGYKRFVVLTSDLNDLYNQTLDRTKNTLHGLTVLDKNEMKHPASAQTPAACVLVVSKNVRVLRRARAIVATASWVGQNVLIIDDEADQASLDTAINYPQRAPSGVNREISALRVGCTSLAFVQTTATPQALLLQDADTPFRPDFVHVTTPGSGYCGGDVFFIKEDFRNPRYLRFVPSLDIVTLRTHELLPSSLRVAIYGFFVSAACLRLQCNVKNFQALVHTSLKRDEHQLVTRLVDDFTRQLAIGVALAVHPGSMPPGTLYQEISQGLQEAYEEISEQLPSGSLPGFPEVLQEISSSIPSTAVIEINSTTGQGVQSNPNRRHVIYVGGAKLGRGVTIKNLLMTYYARDAKSPQIDTVLQHARMYGYRETELPFTRIYLPAHLADRFRQIHLTDNSMRELASSTGKVIPVIPIPLRNLRASRRNVLSQQSVELTTYIGGRQYYPLLPVSIGDELIAQTADLDEILLKRCPNERQVYSVSIAELSGLLGNRTYGQLGAPGAWDDDLIRQAVGLLREDQRYSNRGQLIVGSRSSGVSKLATRGTIPQIQALLPANAGNPPYGASGDMPVLVFVRLTGLTANGWDGIPFWVPNIRFPNGNYAFSLNRT